MLFRSTAELLNRICLKGPIQAAFFFSTLSPSTQLSVDKKQFMNSSIFRYDLLRLLEGGITQLSRPGCNCFGLQHDQNGNIDSEINI